MKKGADWTTVSALVGVICFAAMMEFRNEFGNRWTRGLVAGAAFVMLGLVWRFVRDRDSGSGTH